jgi:hypothetical protein
MSENKNNLAFSRINYVLMIIGIIILASGFFMMTLDKETYGFGIMGLTLGPTVVVLGFLFEIIAILYQGKKK